MTGTVNTTFIMELKVKSRELNQIVNIYAKCHLTNNLSNYDLILGRDKLHDQGIIFHFKNKTTTWQEVSMSTKPSNHTAKEFFVIKESCSAQNPTKTIKHILDTEY